MTNELLTGWDVYWITWCDAIVFGALFFGFGCVLASAMVIVEQIRILRWACPLAAIFLFAVAVFTPTTKQACAILVVPAIANNEEVQGLGGEVMTAARAWLREMTPEEEGGED